MVMLKLPLNVIDVADKFRLVKPQEASFYDFFVMCLITGSGNGWLFIAYPVGKMRLLNVSPASIFSMLQSCSKLVQKQY